MTKRYLLAALVLTLTGCDTLTSFRTAPAKGHYQYLQDDSSPHILNKFELTSTKFITRDFIGETAMDYTVEEGYLYFGIAGTQYRFKVVSADTLRNESASGMKGTYVRVK